MNDNIVADVIERLDYRCAVFSVVDANDAAILLKAYTLQSQKLAAMTAERDALRAQLDEFSNTLTVRYVPAPIARELSDLRAWKDAVPVEAIIAYRANSDESEGMICNGDHEAFVDFAESMRILDAWIETQVQP